VTVSGESTAPVFTAGENEISCAKTKLSGTLGAKSTLYEEEGLWCPEPGAHKNGKYDFGEAGMTITGSESIHVTEK
jgi:hypothetical protein